MASLNDDFAFVAASAERAVIRQRQACEQLRGRATDKAAGLTQHIDLAYGAVESQLSERRLSFSEAPDDTVKADAIVGMRQLLGSIRQLQANLDWLAAAIRPPLDLGTTYYVEDAARAMVARQVELTVVSGTKQGSYATTSNPWEPVIKGWGKGIPKGEPTIVVVFIPRREEKTGLLHPLIIHELGHAADGEHELVETIWQLARNRTKLTKRFAKAVEDFSAAERIDQRAAASHVTERLTSWIAEALCDSLAAHYLGPSYLYSFLTEVVAGTMDDATPTHPPPRQRVRRLLDDLDRLGWADTMSAGAPELDSWVRETAGNTVPYVGIDAFLYWAIDDLHAVIRKTAKSHLKGSVFSPHPEEFSEARELLSAGIPPAQRASGTPIARETIILSCWYAALSSSARGPAGLPDAAEGPEFAEILPAALELSAVTSSWVPTP
jgi:hypothetical protein